MALNGSNRIYAINLDPELVPSQIGAQRIPPHNVPAREYQSTIIAFQYTT